MSKDGKAEYVIIGVGGFLGIDQKDVAIPYGEVKFTDVPMTPPDEPGSGDGQHGHDGSERHEWRDYDRRRRDGERRSGDERRRPDQHRARDGNDRQHRD